MKLLFESTDRSEIDEAKMRLELNGIPVFIGNENAVNIFGWTYLLREYGLWIVIDEQFEDAAALLEDKHHVVAKPVDIEEYYQNLDKLKASSAKTIFNKMMLWITLFFVASYALFVLYTIFIK